MLGTCTIVVCFSLPLDDTHALTLFLSRHAQVYTRLVRLQLPLACNHVTHSLKIKILQYKFYLEVLMHAWPNAIFMHVRINKLN
jgi:hypothetical protein